MLPSNHPGRAPTYDLEEVQRLVGQGRVSCWITKAAERGAAELGLDPEQVVEAVLELRLEHFYKTMESDLVPGLWQDVYHLRRDTAEIYIKLQLDTTGSAVVIQFKRR